MQNWVGTSRVMYGVLAASSSSTTLALHYFRYVAGFLPIPPETLDTLTFTLSALFLLYFPLLSLLSLQTEVTFRT